MNISIERLPNCLATLHVEVPASAINAERQKLISSYTKQANIPGFRPGKAPSSLIEKRYKNEIKEDIEARIVNEAYDESIKKESLKVLDFSDPSDLTYLPDGSLTFQASIMLAPEFTLPDYKNISLSVPSTAVTEQDLSEALEGFRTRFSDYQDITDRTAALGDIAVVDYTSTLDGIVIEEDAGRLAAGTDTWILLKEDFFLPGYATQLVGSAVGDVKDIPVTVKEDFPAEKYQGKEIIISTTIKELKAVVLPELNDEFAAKLCGEGKTLTDLNQLLTKSIEADRIKNQEDEKVGQIISYFDTQVDFEIPADLLNRETQNQINNLVQQRVKSGLDNDNIASEQEDIFANAATQAKTNLKTNFILQEIAHAEKLIVTDQELVQHIVGIAKQRNEDPAKLIKTIQRAGQLNGLRNSLLVNKTLDFLMENAQLTETTPDTNPTPA